MLQTSTQNGYFSVWGAYSEIQTVYPKLKPLGFKYDGDSRSWYIAVADITPLKQKKIDAILGLNTPAGTKPAKKPPLTDTEFTTLWRTMSSKLVGGRHTVILGNSKIEVTNLKAPLPKELAQAGFQTYTVSAFTSVVATPSTLVPEKVDEAVKYLQDLNQEFADKQKLKLDKGKYLAAKFGKQSWPALQVSLYWSEPSLAFIIAGLKANYIKLLIAKSFSNQAVQSSAGWLVSPLRPESEFQDFIRELDSLEATEVARQQAQRKPSAPTQISNRKAGYCAVCGDWVPVGEGWAYRVDAQPGEREYDDDALQMKWVVRHKDTALCQKTKDFNLLKQQAERILAQGKAKAQTEIEHWLNKHESTPSGNHKWPTGHKTILKHVGHQAFLTIVVEPDEKHFWLIRYNGADGDSWSANNIEGHSIGQRAPLTPEIKLLIDGLA